MSDEKAVRPEAPPGDSGELPNNKNKNSTPTGVADDRSTTIGQLRDMVARFVAEREWEQFHAPKNLSMALAIEAAELMEHFQWLSVDASRQVAHDPDRKEAAGEELADVVCYALALANELDLDVSTALAEKMKKNIAKYPASEFRGRYDKPRYDKPRNDKPRNDKPRNDKPRNDKPQCEEPRDEEPHTSV